jgi:hypothetical protein
LIITIGDEIGIPIMHFGEVDREDGPRDDNVEKLMLCAFDVSRD